MPGPVPAAQSRHQQRGRGREAGGFSPHPPLLGQRPDAPHPGGRATPHHPARATRRRPQSQAGTCPRAGRNGARRCPGHRSAAETLLQEPPARPVPRGGLGRERVRERRQAHNPFLSGRGRLHGEGGRGVTPGAAREPAVTRFPGRRGGRGAGGGGGGRGRGAGEAGGGERGAAGRGGASGGARAGLKGGGRAVRAEGAGGEEEEEKKKRRGEHPVSPAAAAGALASPPRVAGAQLRLGGRWARALVLAPPARAARWAPVSPRRPARRGPAWRR